MSDRTYTRAVDSGYDAEHERALVDAIVKAITDTSMVVDTNALVLRTGETASALLTCLAGTLALSPAATRSPTAIRKTVEELRKRLQRRIAAADADPTVQDFIRRAFHGTDVEGSA